MWARTWLMLTLAPDRHFTSTPYVHTTWNSAMWHMSFPPQQPGPRGTCQSRPTWNKCSHHWHGTIKKDVSESLSKWLRCSRNRWFRFISRHFLLHSGVVLNYQTILVGIKGPLRTLDWFQFVLKWPDSIKAPFSLILNWFKAAGFCWASWIKFLSGPDWHSVLIKTSIV